MIKKSLDGEWKVRHEALSCRDLAGLSKVTQASSDWMPAQVPGEVHLDLVRAGLLDEPLISLNAKKSRWPEERSWWFVKSFNASSSFLLHERQRLVFDGLDLYAQVFLNDTLLGETKNAFVPCSFDVSHIIREGENTLVVRLAAGTELVSEALQPQADHQEEVYGGRRMFQGINQLRKPQFSYGWDWVDALPNIGIWRGVRLEAHSGVVLHDIRFHTQLDNKKVFLNAEIIIENLHPWSEQAGNIELIVSSPSGEQISQRIHFSAQVGRSTFMLKLRIPDAQLWWPNGMGEQPLYHVTISVVCNKKTCDQRNIDVGLRTVELDRSAIPSGGSRFCIRINGQDVFCKGGNWIPADAIVARVDKQRCETLIDEARNANINMLRVWGGGIYESSEFYTACDRAGILVWQDFMFACSEYPDENKDFCLVVREEAEQVVMSLRHHPSIVLWCGNNENLWGFESWWNKGKSIGDKDLRVGGSIIHGQILPDVCRALDPHRPYWPSSPSGGEIPNGETDGDCHWWDPATMNKDVNRRIDHEIFDECKARFVSEFGVIGPCHLDSIKQYLGRDELHADSRAWKEHTNSFEKETTPAGIRRHYADPENLSISDYIFYGQMFQAAMYGRIIEALRFRKNDPRDDCQGALFWMYNDCWGETGWTPIDYYLRRKPSYYWIRNANSPVKAIVRGRGKHLVTRVVNDTLKPLELVVCYGWMRIDGSMSKTETKAVCADANSMVEIGNVVIPACKVMDPREWIYVAYTVCGAAVSSPSVWLLKPYRELSVPVPEICISIEGKVLQLVSETYCHGVHFKDQGDALFSDNYFDLLPGIPKSITCLAEKLPDPMHFHALV